MRKTTRLFLIVLAVTLLLHLSACIPDWLPMPTARVFPSLTPGPSATPYPSLTPTRTITPSPTPLTPVRAGTPMYTEGHSISAENIQRLEKLASRGGGIIRQIDHSNDQKMLGIASARGIFIYDSQSLAEINWLQDGHPQRCLAFSADGKTLAAGSESGQVTLWNIKTSEALILLPGNSMLPILKLTFSADGSLLAASTWDGLIYVWQMPQGELVRTFEPLYKASENLAFSEDNSKLYAWAKRESLQVWEISSGKTLDEIYTGYDSRGTYSSQLTFSQDSSLIGVFYGNLIRIFRSENGTTLSQITNFDLPVRQIALSESGLFLGLLQENTISIWNTEDAEKILEINLSGINDELNYLVLSETEKSLSAAGSTLYTWDFSKDSSEPLNERSNNLAEFSTDYIQGKPLNREIKNLSLLFANGIIKTSDLTSGEFSLTHQFTPNEISAAVLSIEDGLLAAGDYAGNIHLIETEDEGDDLQFIAAEGKIKQLVFSEDGELLASTGDGPNVSLWTNTGKLVEEIPLNFSAQDLAFTPDGELLIIQEPGQTRVWSVEEKEFLYEISSFAFTLSPDGSLLAAASIEGPQKLIRVYESKTGKEKNILPVTSSIFAISADNHLLAVQNIQIEIWNIEEEIKIAQLDNPEIGGYLNFSADGKYLLKTSLDGSLHIWGIP